MSYGLTQNQQQFVRWLVEEIRSNRLPEEFHVFATGQGDIIHEYSGIMPDFSRGMLDALEHAGMLSQDIRRETKIRSTGSKARPTTTQRAVEKGRTCTVLGKAFEAVERNFLEPDTSFVTQLTPLADVTNLDSTLKSRCLPVLSTASADPMVWDTAVRNAGIVLEERLRDVGGITDPNVYGLDLVNKVLGPRGSLQPKFTVDSERQGYRDLYAGLVGAIRNPSAHKFIDPSPEEGGAVLVFVNLLLKRLEDLR